MNFEFLTKLGSRHPYQHVLEEHKAYCSKPEKRAYKVQIWKNVLLRKSRFKVFRGYTNEKNSYLNTACANFAETWLWNVWGIRVLILLISWKSVEQSANFKNVLLRKSCLKFLEDIKTKKIHISAPPSPIWLWDVWSVCINPAKFIKIY